MSQILDPVPTESADNILCCYVNATSKIQVARITNIKDWYFERVVFPGQRLMFETMPEALLEIHCGMMASAILSDSIPCDRLRLDKEESIENEDSKRLPEPSQENSYTSHNWALNNKNVSFKKTIREPALSL